LGSFVGKAGRLIERATVSYADSWNVSGNQKPGVQLGKIGFQNCSELFPNKKPLDVQSVNSAWNVVALCSNNFAVLNSTTSKTPLFVVEKLNRELMADAKGEERTDDFYADPRLPPGRRAELIDFSGSGLDRGHLANAADQPDPVSMAQSFALSNMIPQDPVNNRKGAWRKVESDTRKYVSRSEGNVFVFSGPLFFGSQPKTIGPNKVWVPTHLFKFVYDESTGKAWAHIIPNTADAKLGKPIGYQEFVKVTGWRFLM